MDRTFPKPNNNLPSQDLGQNPNLPQNSDNPDLGNTAPDLVDLGGTGDTDLDFLMYQNHIYQ